MPDGATIDINSEGKIVLTFPDFASEVAFYNGNPFLNALSDEDERNEGNGS